MLEDAARYQELESQKQKEDFDFKKASQTVVDDHQLQTNNERKNHNDMFEIQTN